MGQGRFLRDHLMAVRTFDGVHLIDNEAITFGDSDDASLYWDAATSSLKVVGSLDVGALKLEDGETLTFGTDDDATMQWDDAEGVVLVDGPVRVDDTLKLGDGAVLVFGTDDDVPVEWNEALGAVKVGGSLLFTGDAQGIAFGPAFDSAIEWSDSVGTTVPEPVLRLNSGDTIFWLGGADKVAGSVSSPAGDTIAVGDLVALDTASGKSVRCAADHATASVRRPIGFSYTAELADQGRPLLASIQGMTAYPSTSLAGMPNGTLVYAGTTPGALVDTPPIVAGAEVWTVGRVTQTGANGIVMVDICQVQSVVAPDVGTGVAIPVMRVDTMAMGFVVGAGAETNTLANPLYAGQRLVLSSLSSGGGSRAVTAASSVQQAPARTIMTFAPAGDYIELVAIAIGAGFAWRISGNDGVVLS
jgi:hypothetical protein